MALPSLEHQIQFVDSIILARAVKNDKEKLVYHIEEILKSRSDSIKVSTILNTDLTIFELMGYSIHDKQEVIVFLAEKSNGFDCIDFLPIRNGVLEYGVDDKGVHRKLSLSDFREIVLNNKSGPTMNR